MHVAGSGSTQARNDPPPSRPSAAESDKGGAARRDSDKRDDDLADKAANGKPVESGEAMRELDKRNGSREATDAQVSAARANGSSGGGSGGSTTTRNSTETSSAGGTTTTTRTDSTTRSSPDGVERTTDERRTETTSGKGSWSRTQSSSSTRTTKEFDERGDPRIDGQTGRQAETTQSRSERSTETRLDATSASHTTSTSEQRGPVGGGASNSTTMDGSGVGNQTTVSGNAGGANAEAGAGVRIGKDGVTGNVTVGGGVGPASVEHKVEHRQGPNGTADTTSTTATVQGGQNAPVNGKIEYKQTDVRELTRNDDGTTTYQVTGESKLTVAGGVDAKQVGVDASWADGHRTVHTVTVPKGADVKAIDPSKPEDWPEGTRVMTKSEDFEGSTLGASYARFGVEAGQETRSGNAIVMEKKAGDTVGVSAGPTEGFTTSGKLKFDVAGGFGASVGGENKTDFAFYKTYDVDVSTPGGAQAFADAYTGREAPKANGNGVSDLKDTTIGDWSYTGGARIETPFGGFGPERKEGSNNVWTTYPNGRTEYTRTYDANGDGKPELTRTTSSTDGKTWSEAEYKFSVEITDETGRHNGAQMVNDPNLKVGDKVEVSLTAGEVQDLRRKDMIFAPDGQESAEAELYSQNAFAEHIARMEGSDATLGKLFSLNSAPDYGDYQSAPPPVDMNHPLPGEVTVVPG